MNKIATILSLTCVFLITSCSNEKLEEKGFQVTSASDNPESDPNSGLNRDSLKFETRPSNVLLTNVPNVRLTTIYKVNVNKKDNTKFIGSNKVYYKYDETDENLGNNWNNKLMPGLESIYGYNLINISHYDIKEDTVKKFFEKPVLIKTLYYPSFSKDTLNGKPVNRDYFMVSVYNDDTNKDGFINLKDLRRLYLFDINGVRQKALIPEGYSVFKSEYDSDNDFMYVFAQLDINTA